MPTLPYQPLYPASSDTTPRVKKARYGDGYEQRVKDGINNLQTEYDLTFNLVNADAQILLSFFDNLGGSDAFDWQPRGASVAMKFVCDKWGSDYISFDQMSVRAHIYRVYE